MFMKFEHPTTPVLKIVPKIDLRCLTCDNLADLAPLMATQQLSPSLLPTQTM